MTVFGDLEMSTLTELPPGARDRHARGPAADKPRYLERTWQRLREEAGRGRQCYVVCPRIGDGPAGGPDPDGADGTGSTARPGTADPPAPIRPAAAARRSRSWIWQTTWNGPRWRDCVWQCCTAGSRPTRRMPLMLAFAAGSVDVAGHDDGCRGRRGRAERHRDGDHGRRPVRRLPAAPAARPGRPGPARGPVPAWSPRPRRAASRGSASTRSQPPWTGSSCPGSTSSSAARATCSAPPRLAQVEPEAADGCSRTRT